MCIRDRSYVVRDEKLLFLSHCGKEEDAVRAIRRRRGVRLCRVLLPKQYTRKEQEEKFMCSIMCYAGKDVTPEEFERYLTRSRMRGPDAVSYTHLDVYKRQG